MTDIRISFCMFIVQDKSASCCVMIFRESALKRRFYVNHLILQQFFNSTLAFAVASTANIYLQVFEQYFNNYIEFNPLNSTK